jgi:LacI family transcriptional regulator/LacI family purine nucleotide synthesis repressor
MARYSRKVSMQDIASRLGISKNAVSLALNNKQGVSEELRKMVFKAAEELNYGSLGDNKKRGNYILVLIPQYILNDKIFYYEIFWTIEKHTKDHGYHSIVSSVTKEMEEKLLLPDMFYEIDFSGIMVVGVVSRQFVKKLNSIGLPMVLVDNYYDDLPLNAVVTANIEGSYTIVKYLIDNGHKEIGFIAPITMTASFYERWCGYNRAMLESGLRVDEKYCITKPSPIEVSLTDSKQIQEFVNSLDKLPTAWFCGNDRIAITLTGLLIEKGIDVPGEVSIAGFDDIEASRLITPALTTMNVNKALLGVKAVDLLLKKIKRNEEKEVIKIFSELAVRQSVKDLNK